MNDGTTARLEDEMAEQTETGSVEETDTKSEAPELTEFALRALAVLPLAYPVSEEWATTEELQAVLNGQDGAEFVAVQVVEEALTDLFNRGRVDLLGGPPKKWRESDDEIAGRLAVILEKLNVAEMTREAIVEGPVAARADDDIGLLLDAGLIESSDDALRLVVDDDGRSRVMSAIADEVVRSHRHGDLVSTAVQDAIVESASWREKHASEKRRADELSSWIGRKGFTETDVLAEVRGVVQPAKAKKEEFEWTSSRIVDSAEKGVIFGEVLALENAIAAVRLEADESAGEHKSRVKGLEAQIRDLKNAAACNSRVISVRAYKRTDWTAKKVVIHAADDHRVLAEEELPNGAQREIPGTGATPLGQIDEPSDGLKEAADQLRSDLQSIANEGGVTISLATPGKEPVVIAAPQTISTMEQLEPVVLKQVGLLPGKTSEELRVALGLVRIELTTKSGGVLPPEKAIDAALLRMRKQGLVEGPGGGWNLPLATQGAGVTEDPADASLDTSEPGPLASEEARKAHRAAKGKKAKSGEVRP